MFKWYFPNNTQVKQLSDQLATVVESYYGKLLQLSEDFASLKPNPNQWSKKEYLGHLIDSAMNNHQRFVRGQLYDKSAFPAYDQPLWVAIHNYQAMDWKELIDIWKTLNIFLSKVISNVKPETLTNTMSVGKTENLTLLFVIEDYLDHMLIHLNDLIK